MELLFEANYMKLWEFLKLALVANLLYDKRSKCVVKTTSSNENY